jgi:geranylgeranyl diphosphate synthase type II
VTAEQALPAPAGPAAAGPAPAEPAAAGPAPAEPAAALPPPDGPDPAEPRALSLGPPDLPAVLDVYARRTREALLARLDGAAPEVLTTVMREYPARAGKALRPAWVLLTTAALGGSEDAGMDLAVGVEMLHNAFLVHDDISDGSRLRRGGPSLPEQVGLGLSVCAGDALAVEALAVLQEAARPLPRGRVVPDEVDTAIKRTIEGQAIELGWERDGRLDVTVADYLDMVLRKTSWYSVILPCRLGCLAARSGPLGRRFTRFGALAGAVLQIGDDILGLTAPAERTGKDWGDDVLEGKRSLPVIHCLATAPRSDRSRLRRLMTKARHGRKRDDARWVAELLDRNGGFEYARRCASRLAAEAHEELARELSELPRTPQADLLDELVCLLEARVAPSGGDPAEVHIPNGSRPATSTVHLG